MLHDTFSTASLAHAISVAEQYHPVRVLLMQSIANGLGKAIALVARAI
jgi:hypothetical protein